jgi:hypothetical protein
VDGKRAGVVKKKNLSPCCKTYPGCPGNSLVAILTEQSWLLNIILNQFSLVYNMKVCFSQICFNIILKSLYICSKNHFEDILTLKFCIHLLSSLKPNNLHELITLAEKCEVTKTESDFSGGSKNC